MINAQVLRTLLAQHKVAGDAAAPSFMDRAKAYGSQALTAGKGVVDKGLAAAKPLASQAMTAAQPVVDQAITAGKSEIAQAKPLLQNASNAVKPYFNGLGGDPAKWAAGHPIGTGLAIAGAGIGAVALLHHLLHKKTQPQPVDGQPKLAAMHPLTQGVTDLMGSAGPLASKAVAAVQPLATNPKLQSIAGKAAWTAGGATAAGGLGLELQHRTRAAHAPAPTLAAPAAPAPTPGVGAAVANAGRQAGAALGRGVDDAGAYFKGVTSSPGQWMADHPIGRDIGIAGAGIGAVALLHHLLHKKTQPQPVDGTDGQPKLAASASALGQLLRRGASAVKAAHPVTHGVAKATGVLGAGIGGGIAIDKGASMASNGVNNLIDRGTSAASGVIDKAHAAADDVINTGKNALPGATQTISNAISNAPIDKMRDAAKDVIASGSKAVSDTLPAASQAAKDVITSGSKAVSGILPAAVGGAPSPAPGLMDRALAGAKGVSGQIAGAVHDHPYIAAGAGAVSAVALLAHLLNKPSKKDQQGHVVAA
jgi:hypothetical protein